MNIYIYSDESGVLDKAHHEFYVYGGVMFLSNQDRDDAARMYIHAERTLRNAKNISGGVEVKASTIDPASKNKLYRSLNHSHKFAAVVHQKNVLDRIFESKKDKQRYLDYVYKMAVKNKFRSLIRSGQIVPEEVERLYFYVDEHTTATNGLYELRESLEQEFKYGTYNMSFNVHYPPIFPHLLSVELNFCNSANNTLVRSADIIANKVYHHAVSGKLDDINGKNSLSIKHFP